VDAFTWKSKRDLSSPPSIVFSGSLDGKGRVIIPSSVRNRLGLRSNSKVILEINGCDSVMDSVSACGAEGAGSNPARGPDDKEYNGEVPK
jgi:AbrB family looped-hinge helix DNA binding protein